MAENSPKFGITEETRSENAPKILPPQELDKPTNVYPQGFKFPQAYLKSVKLDKEFETKNGNTEVLEFLFIDKDKREHRHIEWSVDLDDEKFQTKKEGLESRIKHIYEQFAKFPKTGIGTKATNFVEFLEAIEQAFSEIDTNKYCWLKLVYYKGNLNFPLYPNFIQRITDKTSCKLEIGRRDNIKTKAGNSDEGALPDLPGEDGDTPNFDQFD